MCVVSMVGDHYNRRWNEKYPWFQPFVSPQVVPRPQDQAIDYGQFLISREEFDALKAEVQNLKELLIAAKEYDAKNHEPDCEIEGKMDKLRKMAELVGIDLDEVLKHGA